MIDFERAQVLLDVVHKCAGTAAYNAIAQAANVELGELADEARGALVDDAKAKKEAAEAARPKAIPSGEVEPDGIEAEVEESEPVPTKQPTLADRRL